MRDRLGTHLAPLKYQKKIVEWYDRKIEPGAHWETEISAQLESAHLIVLLVSADFLASEYCFGVEVEKAFTLLKRGQVKVVTILLEPCLWEESLFSTLQIIPRDAKPITSWASPDEAFKDVAKEISTLVSEPPPSLSVPSSELWHDVLFSSRRLPVAAGILRRSTPGPGNHSWRFGAGAREMRKLPLLQKDLQFFEPRTIADVREAVDATLKVAEQLRLLSGERPLALLGCVYVSEGSTLGATCKSSGNEFDPH